MIDTEEKLGVFVRMLQGASWVAVDTEADSLHAYPEKVCLIQVSTVAGDELVDPLAGVDINPMLDALTGHELIMHGADYDLRLLCKHHKFIPSAVFDTMLAGRLLGLRQFGLSHLVEQYLGVKLEKGAQKANWALRPLTDRMERYARNDTHYLKPLADKLKGELEGKGRLGWHQESCASLVKECSADRPQDLDAVWRIKGSHLLGRAGLAVLRELWKWREREAVASNKPPFFVVNHEVLVDVAAAAGTQRPFQNLLPRHLSERRRGGLIKAVTQGLDTAPNQLPEILRPISRRPNESEKRRFLELQKRRDAEAERLQIDPTLIASRAALSALAHNYEQNVSELMNWQRELLQSA